MKAQVFWGVNMLTGNEQPKKGSVTLNMKRLRYLHTSVTVINRRDVNIPEVWNLHKHGCQSRRSCMSLFRQKHIDCEVFAAIEKAELTLLVASFEQQTVNEMRLELTQSQKY